MTSEDSLIGVSVTQNNGDNSHTRGGAGKHFTLCNANNVQVNDGVYRYFVPFAGAFGGKLRVVYDRAKAGFHFKPEFSRHSAGGKRAGLGAQIILFLVV